MPSNSRRTWLRAAPQRRRRGERRRGRQVAAHDLEQLADQALGGPVDEADAPARTGDAGQLVRDDLVARRELHAEGRQDAVEGRRPRRAAPRRRPRPSRRRRRAAAARARAVSNSSGVRSRPTTCAPAAAARIARLPVPVATSSTSWPGLDVHAREQVARRDLVDVAGDGGVITGGPGGAVHELELGDWGHEGVLSRTVGRGRGECPRPPLREPCENPVAGRQAAGAASASSRCSRIIPSSRAVAAACASSSAARASSLAERGAARPRARPASAPRTAARASPASARAPARTRRPPPPGGPAAAAAPRRCRRPGRACTALGPSTTQKSP